MKINKVILYVIILPAFFRAGSVFSAFWLDKIKWWLQGSTDTVDIVVQDYIVYLFWFLALIAILYWIYWGFSILSAWDDEEKVSKWKTIIIQAIIWLLIIFLAWPITSFFIWWSNSEWWSGTWILSN